MTSSLAPGEAGAARPRGELRYGLELARLLGEQAVLDQERERWTG